MKQRQHITGFYLETLLLILVFIAIILVLTQVFGIGKAQSGEAKLLTDAVTLAQNGAEAFYGTDDAKQLASLLNTAENVSALNTSVTATFDADLNPDRGGELRLQVDWTRKGDALEGTAAVYYGTREAAIYSLPLYKPVGEVTP